MSPTASRARRQTPPAGRATAAGLCLVVAGLAAAVPAVLSLDAGLVVRRVADGDRILATSAPAGTAAALALAVVAGGWVALRLPSRPTALVGALGAGIALGGTSSVDDPNTVLIYLLITTAFAAASLVHQRALLIEEVDVSSSGRLLSIWWASAGFGVLLVFVARIGAEPDLGDELHLAAFFTLLGTLVLAADRSPSTADRTDDALRFRVTTPGSGRTVALWASLGVAFGGAAPTARIFLAERWQLDAAGQAGVLSGAVLLGVLTLLVAHWWWDLAALGQTRLPRIVGTAALAAAALVAVGAWSYTYPGLIFSWMLAGAATAIALVAFDQLVLVPAERPIRRRLSALQPVLFALGALVGAALIPLAGDSGRLRLFVAVVPLGIVGWRMQRGALEPSEVQASTDERPLPTAVSIVDDAPLLSCESLDVSYGPVQVLFDVSLEVHAGEAVALLGTNGAGKTTLLRTIAGLLAPDAGAVRLAGADITTFPADWRPGLGLAHVAGADSLAGPLTVDEHLRLFAIDLDADELDARLDRTFEVFPRLAERRGQVVSTLSGGEKQMLALAKAFVHRPDVLLVDEFSLGLAPIIVSELIPVLAELNAEGTAVLLVEQSVATALELADRVLCLERGGIVYEGTAAELRGRPDLLEAVYLEGITQALADEGAGQ